MRLSDFYNKTDKGYAHNMLGMYERLIADREIRSILEVGVLNGESIRMFAETYPDAYVVGADIRDCSSLEHEYSNVRIYQQNAYDSDFVEEMVQAFGGFYFIVEDGSHILKDQCFAAASYPQLLVNTGLLIIEDIASIEDAHVIQHFIPDEFKSQSYIIDRRGAPCDYPYQRFEDRNEILVVVDREIR